MAAKTIDKIDKVANQWSSVFRLIGQIVAGIIFLTAILAYPIMSKIKAIDLEIATVKSQMGGKTDEKVFGIYLKNLEKIDQKIDKIDSKLDRLDNLLLRTSLGSRTQAGDGRREKKQVGDN